MRNFRYMDAGGFFAELLIGKYFQNRAAEGQTFRLFPIPGALVSCILGHNLV